MVKFKKGSIKKSIWDKFTTYSRYLYSEHVKFGDHVPFGYDPVVYNDTEVTKIKSKIIDIKPK